MFRPLRRAGQELSKSETEEVLKRGTSGVLAIVGDDGYPYAVPLSYVYEDDKIWFHCAKTGHKIDALKNDDKTSFCVIDKDGVIPEEYTTYFRSVIAFGRVHMMEDEKEKRKAIEKLAIKYAPNGTKEGRDAAIEREWAPLCMLQMDIEHMTGKEAIEPVRRREAK